LGGIEAAKLSNNPIDVRFMLSQEFCAPALRVFCTRAKGDRVAVPAGIILNRRYHASHRFNCVQIGEDVRIERAIGVQREGITKRYTLERLQEVTEFHYCRAPQLR
jgi:hypothetical protein